VGTQQVTPDVIDFAVAAYREDGLWTVVPLPPALVVSAEGVVSAIRQLPGDDGVFGAVSVADEFFVLAHTVRGGVRIMISDAAALPEWSLASEAMASASPPKGLPTPSQPSDMAMISCRLCHAPSSPTPWPSTSSGKPMRPVVSPRPLMI